MRLSEASAIIDDQGKHKRFLMEFEESLHREGWGKVGSTCAFSPSRFSFSIALRLMAFTFTASAPLDELKNTTPEQGAKTQTEFMKLKLGLTPDQPRKVTHTVVKWVKRPKVKFIGDR